MLVDKLKVRQLHIDEKLRVSKDLAAEALSRFKPDKMALAITGGKDSTTALWIFRKACEELGMKLPVCMFIDEGDVFDEIDDFVRHIKKRWSLNIEILKNEDVSSRATRIGDMIKVSSLSPENQAALVEIGHKEPEFPFVPDSTVCNHLMKTVPMRNFIAGRGINAVSVAIRWDEQDARKEEDFFSERANPAHTRVHPILHFSERDIWVAIFKYEIPFNSLYRLGYRSLGARCATERVSDIPAWMQDLENTPERGGRGQEKEKIMDQLRALGYM